MSSATRPFVAPPVVEYTVAELRAKDDREMLTVATLEQAVWGAAISAARDLGLNEEHCQRIANAAMAAAMVAYHKG